MENNSLGFLSDSLDTAKQLGAAVAGFLDAGLDAAETVKGRIDVFKKRFNQDSAVTEQHGLNLSNLFANQDNILVFGSIAIIGAAILYSAVTR